MFEVDDLSAARLRRDASGVPEPVAVLASEGDGIGPGLCTYDAASATGIVLVQTWFDLEASPPSVVFSMHATGVHP